jgi:hypothetical protein
VWALEVGGRDLHAIALPDASAGRSVAVHRCYGYHWNITRLHRAWRVTPQPPEMDEGRSPRRRTIGRNGRPVSASVAVHLCCAVTGTEHMVGRTPQICPPPARSQNRQKGSLLNTSSLVVTTQTLKPHSYGKMSFKTIYCGKGAIKGA